MFRRSSKGFAIWTMPKIVWLAARAGNMTGFTHQASVFSMTSDLTNASKHCVKVTFEELRPEGKGSVKYIKLLYVVDVCINH